ncbi:hypothetical protein DESC_120001 [Desulfosarcina cetonica]|nr:hypothetical protein DESC_120001 [Desulfosarcina cetonica]
MKLNIENNRPRTLMINTTLSIGFLLVTRSLGLRIGPEQLFIRPGKSYLLGYQACFQRT